jgi:hypothetical protein
MAAVLVPTVVVKAVMSEAKEVSAVVLAVVSEVIAAVFPLTVDVKDVTVAAIAVSCVALTVDSVAIAAALT